MKKILIITTLFLLCHDSFSAKKIKGLIIYENDTVRTTFNMPYSVSGKPNYLKIQYGIKYFENGKKKTLTAKDAKEYQFNHDGEKIRMVSVQLTEKKKVFLKINVDKRLKHYYFYDLQYFYNGNSSTSNLLKKDVLQKGDEKPLVVERYKIGGFKKSMIKYFKDCPGLAMRFKNKVYGKKNIRSAVSYYNSKCKN